MKKLFKGAIPTIALLLVAVMSLTSLTYAWFTAGNQATVDTVNVNVKSVEGLLVSSDGFNGSWGSSLTPVLGTQQPLQDVSTVGAIDSNGNIVFYNTVYAPLYDAITKSTVVSARADGSNNNYDEFIVYIKNEANSDVTVNLGGSTVSGPNLSRAAARVGLVNLGTASASAFVNNGSAPNISGTPELIGIWEPNAKEHTSDAQTWLNLNGQGAAALGTDNATYMGVMTTWAGATDAYVNVATGEKFSIVSAALTLGTPSVAGTYTSAEVPNDVDYYVYTASTATAANHFRALAIEDFFKAITPQAASDSTGKALANTAYTYDSANHKFTVVATGTQIDGATAYYQIATVGTATNDVKAYTSDKYTALATPTDLTAGKDAYVITSIPENACIRTGFNAYTALTLNDYFTAVTVDADNLADVQASDTAYYTFTAGVASVDPEVPSTYDTYNKVADNNNLVAGETYYTFATVANLFEENDSTLLDDVTTQDVGTAAGDLKFTVAANTIMKVRVVIWIEGQDADCTNYVADKPFEVNLVFSK